MVVVQELLSQCKHYSEKVRLKALNGLIELLREYPSEARVHASEIFSNTLNFSADSDLACRAAYCSLLRTALFPALGAHALQPFLPFLMGHICTSMTHLSYGIRASGIQMMNVILEYRPDAIGKGYFPEICEHFIDSSSRSSRGRSISAGSLKNLESLVDGCHKFLKLSLPFVEFDDRSNHLLMALGSPQSNMFKKQQQKAGGVSTMKSILLNGLRLVWKERTMRELHSKDLFSNQSADLQTKHASALLSSMLECWEECGLASDDIVKDAAAERCGWLIIRCCILLIKKFQIAVLMDGENDNNRSTIVAKVLHRILPYFPFSGKGGGTMREIDTAAAELIVSVIHCIWIRHSDRYDEDLQGAVQSLASWCKFCLQSIADSSAFPVGVQVCGNLMPLVDSDTQKILLEQAFESWSAVPLGSGHRNKGLKLVLDMLRPPLVQAAQYVIPNTPWPKRSQARIKTNIISMETDCVFATWISEIPSFLYRLWKQERSETNPHTVQLGLSVIFNAARFVSVDCHAPNVLPKTKMELEKLSVKMIPLFAIRIKEKIVSGPLTIMSEDLQTLAIEILYHLPGLDKHVIHLIGTCIDEEDLFPLPAIDRLLELIYFKSQFGDPESVWSLIISCMKGSKSLRDAWNFENHILDRMSRIALHCSPPSLAIQAVLPALLTGSNSVENEASERSTYGALYFLHRALCMSPKLKSLEISSELLYTILASAGMLIESIDSNKDDDRVMADTVHDIVQNTISKLLKGHPALVESIIRYLHSCDKSAAMRVEAVISKFITALEDLDSTEDSDIVGQIRELYSQMEEALMDFDRKVDASETLKTLTSQLQIIYKMI